MDSDELPPGFQDLVKDSKLLIERGGDAEAVLALARLRGYSKMESARLSMIVLGANLSQAKRLIDESQVWADTKQDDQRLKEILRRIEG